jgi:hypothetical protein
MTGIKQTHLPPDSLLEQINCDRGGYVDCFSTKVTGRIALSDYIHTFYTTRLFRAERMVLGLAGLGGSDEELTQLAAGHGDVFAAWRQQARTESEILMRQVNGPTASWLMVRPLDDGTELLFGSAVLPSVPGGSIGLVTRALTPLHLFYSRALLRAAAKRLN